ncbi:hypothetical protein EOT10_39445 [Streptomyces antnestii]|uniref:Uncharacterized protein n=1 Tax=Streptomyces antnestii TaxID=2494256 RepID=A0A3S2VR58_9ACTN|nr:hypothetical protein [Streptomyces sp. San01]RVU15245.1 hypothetical protein EOT10_39445 [Streptomyces sp. San01]
MSVTPSPSIRLQQAATAQVQAALQLTSIGTGGFSLSDNRANAHGHFGADIESIVVHTLRTLVSGSEVKPDAAERYGLG